MTGDDSMESASLRVAAMAIIRLLCVHSASFASAAEDTRLLETPRAALVSEQWRQPSMVPGPAVLAETLEALRVWHACVCAGHTFLQAEDAFPCMLVLAKVAEGATQSLACPQDRSQEASGNAGVTSAQEHKSPAKRGAKGHRVLYFPDTRTRSCMHAASQADACLELPESLQGAPPHEAVQDVNDAFALGVMNNRMELPSSAGSSSVEQPFVKVGTGLARGLDHTSGKIACKIASTQDARVASDQACGHTHRSAGTSVPDSGGQIFPTLACATMQQLCVLLVTMLHCSFPAPDIDHTRMGQVADRLHAPGPPSISLGFAQQLLPLATNFLRLCTLPAHLMQDKLRWPAAEAWLASRAEAAAAAARPAPAKEAAALCELNRSLPQPPHSIALAALLPLIAVVQAARSAAWHLAAELVAARPELPAAAIVDHVTAACKLADLASSAQMPRNCGGSLLSSALMAAVVTREATARASLAAGGIGGPSVGACVRSEMVSAARSVLACAAELHTGRHGRMSRLRAHAVFSAGRLQATQLHAAAFVFLASAHYQCTPNNGLFSGPVDDTFVMVLRALLAVPCCVGPSASTVLLQGLQLLFAPQVATIMFSAGEKLMHGLSKTHAALAAEASARPAADEAIDTSAAGNLLVAAYASAWLGHEAATSATLLKSHHVISTEQSMQWQDPQGAVGRRLPVPLDWFVLALASPDSESNTNNEGGGWSGATGVVQTLAAATTWLLGLYQTGVLACCNDEFPSLQEVYLDPSTGKVRSNSTLGDTRDPDAKTAVAKSIHDAVCITGMGVDLFLHHPVLKPKHVRSLQAALVSLDIRAPTHVLCTFVVERFCARWQNQQKVLV
jgi:hypothetical protein